jgi:hypothetical protein
MAIHEAGMMGRSEVLQRLLAVAAPTAALPALATQSARADMGATLLEAETPLVGWRLGNSFGTRWADSEFALLPAILSGSKANVELSLGRGAQPNPVFLVHGELGTVGKHPEPAGHRGRSA